MIQGKIKVIPDDPKDRPVADQMSDFINFINSKNDVKKLQADLEKVYADVPIDAYFFAEDVEKLSKE